MGSQDTGPAYRTNTLVQHDTNKIAFGTTRGILVIVGGAVKVGFVGGGTDTYTALPVGWHPIKIDMLYDTGTGAAVEIHGAY